MSLHRFAVLFGKEFRYALKSYFLIFAVVAPVVLTLAVNLLFGSIFSGKPKLGLFSPVDSPFLHAFNTERLITVKIFHSEAELKEAVQKGVLDMGIRLPEQFEKLIHSSEKIRINALIYGQSLLKNRALIRSVFLREAGKLSARESPIDMTMISLGEGANIPWKERFFPIIVLLAIFISGFTIPSSLLVEEKEKKTLGAVLTTPVTPGEMLLSKAAIGVLASLIMSVMTLVLNGAFHSQFGLTILILFLGAAMASCFGLILGAFVNEMATLYSAIKGMGIILYGPGIIALFPKLPQWIGKLFPTYYVMKPVIEISQKGGDWRSVKLDILILIGIVVILVPLVGVVAGRIARYQE